MKKVLTLLLLVFTVVLLTGCEEIENPTVRGYKDLGDNNTEEIVYEWDYYEPERMIKITKIFTYKSATNTVYNMKAIDCDTFKRQGSLFDCKVERKDGEVVYREFYYKDEVKTKDEARQEILKLGYKIK